jgi:hypothetical protein
LTFNAKRRAAIKRWMGQAVPLEGVYFRGVEYRYMDPAYVLSGQARGLRWDVLRLLVSEMFTFLRPT